VVALQLVPLPARWLASVSPATDRAVRQYDLTYAASQAAGTVFHPLSIEPSATVKGLVFLIALTVFLCGSTAMMPHLRVRWFVRRLAALGLVMAVFGIVQRGTFNNKLYWVWTPINTPGNAFGPFVNRNHFAGWMLMASALTAGYVCALTVREGPRRHLAWKQRIAAIASSAEASRLAFTGCALAVMVLSIVWTLSRSGILALAVAVVALSGQVFLRFRGARRVAIAGLLVALVAAAIAWRGIDTVADWYSRTSTFEWRVQLWRDTLPIIRDFRWFGTGFNTYGVSTLLYPMTDKDWHAVEAHSDYVQIVSEGGIVLAAAVLLVLFQLVRGIRAAFAQPQRRTLYWVRVGATVGLVAIAIQELVEFSLQIPGNAMLFVVLTAIALHRPSRHDRPV
jgi:O-antigen ligase